MVRKPIASIVLALVCLALAAAAAGVLAENIDPNNDNSQFAYGENVGWLNAEPSNCSGCGMQVGDTAVTGYLWGENIGWVNLNCSNDATCGGGAGNWGVTNDNAGNLAGYAWGENVGWISFSCQNNPGTCAGAGNYGVTINTGSGDFSGFAYGENIGWISFADTSPVAYKVNTGWRPATLTVNSDNDADDGVCNTTHCSLREAINTSNSLAGAQTIRFNIPGGGVRTITPATALPAVSDPVTIDATTQPGYGGSPLIELNGTSAGGGAYGLDITAGSSTVKGFVINRFSGGGIRLTTNGGNTIVANYLGTDAAGTGALANGYGILASFSGSNTIGGTTAPDRNLISGNSFGVVLAGAANTYVLGNYIGTTVSGTAALGNSNSGIDIGSGTGTQIGGALAGMGNVIAFNGGVGVNLDSASTGNQIRGNSIHSNGSLGIDLYPPAGVTANDAGDGDTGANNQQNFPVLTSASGGASTTIAGSLNSTASTGFTIEFFSNPTCDGSGNGEGQVYLGSLSPVTTDGSGNVGFTKSGLSATTAGDAVTATATRNSAPLDTSEFSACLTVSAGGSDGDGDGVPDPSDNCPGVSNPGQENTDATLNAGGAKLFGLPLPADGLGDACDTDDDNDQFSDVIENAIGTNPLDNCPKTPGPGSGGDSWPLDNVVTSTVTAADILSYKGKTPHLVDGTHPKRLDLDNDNHLTVADILKYKGKSPSSCS